MPVYVYECPNCKSTWKIEYKVEERDIWTHLCNKCNTKDMSHVMKRIIAPTSFILKGSGWAKDGYSK